MAGGQIVTLSGTALSNASDVTFGGTSAATFTVESDASITATTPAHAAGTVDVVVTTPGGSGTASGAYTFVDLPVLIYADDFESGDHCAWTLPSCSVVISPPAGAGVDVALAAAEGEGTASEMPTLGGRTLLLLGALLAAAGLVKLRH